MEIETFSLSKTYDNGKQALRPIDISFRGPGIFSIIGLNGAGKTTLVRILATQLTPTSGTATVGGFDILRDTPRVREIIACVPQEARAVPWLTPLQTVSSYLMWRGYTYRESRQMALEALGRVGLSDEVRVKNRMLSGGMKRKVLVACAIASEAEVLFLDEPTTGLDHISRKDLWSILRDISRERTIVLTTHYLDEAESLSRSIAVMSHGRLLALGSMDDLRSMMKHPVSIRVYGPPPEVTLENGTVVRMEDGEQIFTDEGTAQEYVRVLISRGTRFYISPVTLNEVFESLVRGERGGEAHSPAD